MNDLKIMIHATAIVAASLLSACAGIASEAVTSNDCAALDGTYSATPTESGSEAHLFTALTGRKSAGSRVTLSLTDTSLSIISGRDSATLAIGSDFKCERDGSIELMRQDSARLRLPPLIDQTVTTSYSFVKNNPGEIVMKVFEQTTIKPYGKEMIGPRKPANQTLWRSMLRTAP